MTALVTLLAIAVGLLALLVAGLLRSHAEILRSLRELGVDLDPDGRPASAARPSGSIGPRPEGAVTIADVAGTDPFGAPQRVAVAGVDHLTLLVFLSSTCLTCREFWTAFAEPTLDVPGDARVVVVTRGEEAESPSSIRKLHARRVHTVMSTDAWEAYNVPGAPYFVLVDGRRGSVIGEGTAQTWERVQNLIEQSLADLADGRDVDRDLRAAGIEPGDPSLYPESHG